MRPTVLAYFEQAHADARQCFCAALGLSLDPRVIKPAVDYPASLPIQTKKGYFGEVFCGILAEGGKVAGEKKWTVPIFLFRLHQQAEEFLFRLITGEAVADQIPGRTGSDCLALALDTGGEIEAILAAEAKCYEKFNITKAHEALCDLGSQAAVPVSLPQLKRLLMEIGRERYEPTILALERIISSARQPIVPRRDLMVFIFEDPAVQQYTTPRISVADVAAHHGNGRPLQVVEVHLPGAESLIKRLYEDLYQGRESADAAAS